MRYRTKVNLLELLDTLEMAIKYVLHNSGEVADRVYGDTLNCISFIEKMAESEQNSELLDLCKDCRKYIVKKSDMAIKLSTNMKSIVQLAEETYEVLFLPYKADMWDSFDSIWREVSRDSYCHAVVMPIPYNSIDRKNNKVVEIYEGDRFDEELQIVNYKDYNIEAVHPDVIFIHNPYDEYNRVTQVKSDYFSSRLLMQTDRLVYIPYYVVVYENTMINNAMFQLPAIKRSWKTFVQSEKIRELYLKAGNAPEQIIAMGSPKLDLSVNNSKENYSLPPEWKNKIKDRKVILLNTHLDNIMNAASELLEHLAYLFRLFSKTDSVVLIWRPHPLSIKTFQSMRPEWLEKYTNLVSHFQSMKNGIYDTSFDVHRAIGISDAYLGDSSSLLLLYGITGKPMMLMEPLMGRHNQRWLTFIAGVKYGDWLYAAADSFNGFFKISLLTNEIVYLGKFEQETYSGNTMYCRAFLHKNNCWFIPQYAKYIVKVNLDTLDMKYISLPTDFHSVQNTKLQNYISDNKFLWMVSTNTEIILQLDLETEDMKIISGWFETEKLDRNQVNLSHVVMIGKEIWMNIAEIQKMIIINTDTGEFRKLDLGYPKDSLGSIVYDGKFIWLAPYNYDKLVRLNPKTEVIEEIVLERKFKLNQELFTDIRFFSGFLWLIPWKYDKIIRVDITNFEILELDVNLPGLLRVKTNLYGFFSKAFIYGDELVIPLFNANMAVRIKADQLSTLIPCMLNLSESKYFEYKNKNKYDLDNEYPWKNYIKSDENYSIEMFINDVMNGKEKYSEERKMAFCQLALNSDGSCGKKIWNYIKTDLLK